MQGETRLGIQLRVLFALVIREMTTRYGRSLGGYIWALFEPLATVALLTAVFSQIAQHPALGTSFALFYATGYMAFHVYMDISRTVSNSVKVNRALLTFPRVTMLDTIIARFALQLLTAVAVFAIVTGGARLFLGIHDALDYRAILLALSLAALLGLGVGAVNCVLFAFSPTWERIFGIVNRPMFLISGVFFTYESMPTDIRELVWWNPLIHVTALARQGFYPYYQPSFLSIAYVLFLSLGLMGAGVLMLRLLRRRMLDG